MHETELTEDQLPQPDELLPAWFTTRMMSDVWVFGLIIGPRTMVVISTIHAIRQDANGGLWLDAEMHDDVGFEAEKNFPGWNFITAISGDRDDISINASHVIGALELAST